MVAADKEETPQETKMASQPKPLPEMATSPKIVALVAKATEMSLRKKAKMATSQAVVLAMVEDRMNGSLLSKAVGKYKLDWNLNQARTHQSLQGGNRFKETSWRSIMLLTIEFEHRHIKKMFKGGKADRVAGKGKLD